MDTFKTRPGSSEELLITEENFTNKTKKQFPKQMQLCFLYLILITC